jgi:hypothetical protein
MNKKLTEPTEGTRELDAALLHDEIARLAHALWEERGCGDGFAEQDWLEAERRLQETQLREPLGLQTKSQAA